VQSEFERGFHLFGTDARARLFYGAVVEDDGDVKDPVYNDDIPDDTARFLFPSALE